MSDATGKTMPCILLGCQAAAYCKGRNSEVEFWHCEAGHEFTVTTDRKESEMQTAIIEALKDKLAEALIASTQPDPEREPNGQRDSVNEWGRNVAYGRAQAFEEALRVIGEFADV